MYLQKTVQVKSPDAESTIHSRTLRPIQWGLVIIGGGVSGATLISEFVNAVGPIDRLAWLYLGLGVCLFLFGIALDRLPSSFSLFLGSSLLSLLVACGCLGAFRVDPFEITDRLLLALFPPEVGIWEFDDRYGYNHRPGSSGRFQKGEIDVQYDIDPQGFRVTPDPERPRGRIVCLGCSFTFGTGVEDDEPYPYVLGEDYWKDYKVRNRGLTGWGTQHAYLALLEELQETVSPTMVFYGWIPSHRERNYIRKSWVEHIGRKWGLTRNLFGVSDFRRHPHFEIEDGELVFQGVVGPGDVQQDPPDLKEREIALTLRFIVEMNRLTREESIPFYLLNLPVDPGTNPLETTGKIETPGYLLDAVEKDGIPYLDLMDTNRGFLPGDYHPNRLTHREIARALGENQEIREILYPFLEYAQPEVP